MRKAVFISLPLFFIAGGYLFWCYAHSEAYCFFCPSIDTQFAPGYSEQAFSQISTGMTTTLVREKLGQPLYVQYHADGELWFYTLDGKCRWGDWAWLCRQVEIREGRVVKVIKQVLYN